MMMMMDDDAEMRLQVRLDYRQFIDDLNSKNIQSLNSRNCFDHFSSKSTVIHCT